MMSKVSYYFLKKKNYDELFCFDNYMIFGVYETTMQKSFQNNSIIIEFSYQICLILIESYDLNVYKYIYIYIYFFI